MFDQLNAGFRPASSPSNFNEAWAVVWDLRFKFLTRNGYCELGRYEKHLKVDLGALQLTEITPFLLEQFKAKLLSTKMSPQTAKHILNLIKRVYNYLIKMNLYNGVNPASQIIMPKADNSRHRFLSKEDAHKLLEALKRKSLKVWQMSLLSLSTGMRAGEIFNLRGEHINFNTKSIRIVDPKNGKNRTVYMPIAATQMLKDCEIIPGKLVFPSTNGKQIKAISDTFSRVVNRLGLNDGLTDSRDILVFHSLRHTFASWLVQEDQPLYLVAELLGHSTLEMTKRYAHLSQKRQQGATNILDLFL